ncbi:MAG: hypothetical protein K0R38_7572 [Polyangiaceae bacterium]|nr:hypothetical protein [Polyangiaceae bacterium]
MENIVAEPTDTKKTPGRVSRAATVMASSAAVGASWMALVAATTMGLGHLDRVRAQVSADTGALGTTGGRYRLVVQSYERDSVPSGNVPNARQKPLASAQRSVTAEELSRGVAVDVLHVGESLTSSQVIVAWIEQGEADLEFDGAEARPSATALYGAADSRELGDARVVLKSRSA